MKGEKELWKSMKKVQVLVPFEHEKEFGGGKMEAKGRKKEKESVAERGSSKGG